jgi:hypothetical protein
VVRGGPQPAAGQETESHTTTAMIPITTIASAIRIAFQ